jgi:Leucine-rich repeat (LRR) protein
VEDWFDKERKQRTTRGASWTDSGTGLLSSFRVPLDQNSRQYNHGFRIVAENRIPAGAASAPAKPGATPSTAPAASGATATKPPTFFGIGVTATNPPAPAGKGTPVPKPPLLPAPTQPWQAPLRAAGAESKSFGKLPDGTWVVDLDYATIRDLKTLSGVPISRLRASYTEVADLSPLRGMALKELWLSDTKVTDLTPLKGLPIEVLSLKGTLVTDLSPLRGMPLALLKLHDCPDLIDLAPLAEMKALTDLTLPPNAKDIEFLRKFPKLERLSFKVDRQNGDRAKQTAAEFWKKYDSEGWVRALRAAGIDAKKLEEKEDGTWHVFLEGSTIADIAILRGAPISVLELGNLAVSDLEPLRGMPLRFLRIFNTKVTDLSPLQGMPIDYLHMSGTKVTDLSALRGMPLASIRLHGCSELTDISPLANCEKLTNLTLPPNVKNIEFLRALPTLERISFTEQTEGWTPDKTAAEFWREYDAKKQ